jgi:hypothetical protein
MLRVLITPVTAVAAILALTADPAYASGIRECGNYGYREATGTSGWGMSPIDGAGTYNLTTRRVTCPTARRFVLRYRGTDSHYPTWRCREVNDYEFSDVRCSASGGRVIHWQAGA